MNAYLKQLLTLLGLLAIVGCGGGGGTMNGREGGLLQVVVKNAKGPLDAGHARIATYRITVEGEGGEEEPITLEVPGDAGEATIDQLPKGGRRRVLVQAINMHGQTVRAGERDGVVVQGGETTQVEVLLESVPIFVNVKDGDIVDNTRLLFQILSAPGETVTIDDQTEQTKTVTLLDSATSLSDIVPDAASGLGRFVPPLLAAGQHTFTVRNIGNGRSSNLSIKLSDGTKRRAAPLFSTGSVGARAGTILEQLGGIE